MKNTESTQDVPKIEANKLYSVIHDLVPHACLFTIVPIPEHREEESYCSLMIDHLLMLCHQRTLRQAFIYQPTPVNYHHQRIHY